VVLTKELERNLAMMKGSTPSMGVPSAPTSTNIKEFVVRIERNGYYFDCKVTWPLTLGCVDPSEAVLKAKIPWAPSRGGKPSQSFLEARAFYVYGAAIDHYVSRGGLVRLPDHVREVSEGSRKSFIIKPIPKSNFDSSPTCEADKPIGTRDVDKSLQEQQAEIMKRMFS